MYFKSIALVKKAIMVFKSLTEFSLNISAFILILWWQRSISYYKSKQAYNLNFEKGGAHMW